MNPTPPSSLPGRAPADAPVVVRLDGRRLVRRLVLACLLVELVLFLLDATVNHARWADSGAIRRLFNTTREDALASWFGVTQTFAVACTLAWIATVERARGVASRVVTGWTVLAAFFLYMAVDDGSMLHERVGTAYAQSRPDGAPELISYGWQVVFLPSFAVMGAFLLWFLWRELGDRRSRAVVVGALGLLALAVGMDFIEGMSPGEPWNPYARWGRAPAVTALADAWFRQSGYQAILHFSKSIEETLEMVAMTLLWGVFLRHLVRVAPRQHVHLG